MELQPPRHCRLHKEQVAIKSQSCSVSLATQLLAGNANAIKLLTHQPKLNRKLQTLYNLQR